VDDRLQDSLASAASEFSADSSAHPAASASPPRRLQPLLPAPAGTLRGDIIRGVGGLMERGGTEFRLRLSMNVGNAPRAAGELLPAHRWSE